MTVAPSAAGYVEAVRAEIASHGFALVARGDGHVSQDGEAFVAAFAKTPSATIRLPARATEPFVLAKGAMRVEVALLAANGAKGQIDGDAVVYPGTFANATLFHVPTLAGTEEYVRFDARPDQRHLRYRLRFDGVAGLRIAAGDTLELLDRDGNPVLRTTAPWVIDAEGKMRRGVLALEDCAADTSAAAPWGRPVVAPSSKGCTLRASWEDEGLAYPVLVDPPWTDTGALATKRWLHAASTITGSAAPACAAATGCVLVTGGMAGTGTSAAMVTTAELYNAATGTWASATSATFVGRRLHTQDDRANGTAMVVGGATDTSSTATTSAQIYNPTSGWSNIAGLPAARYAAAQLDDYVTGGYASGGTTAQTSMYIWNGSSWTTGTAMPQARAYHQITRFVTGTSIACDGLIVAGGTTGSTALSSASFYGISAGSGCAGTGWSSIASAMSSPRQSFGAVLVGGKVYLFGGDNSLVSGPSDIIDVLSWSSATGFGVAPWAPGGTTAKLQYERIGLTGALAHNGANYRVLAIGGNGAGAGVGATAASDVIDYAAGKVVTGTPLNHARAYHTATTLPSGKVLVAGGAACGKFGCSYPSAEEIWDLGANGSTCADAEECISGICVDGVCCNASCGGQCQACDVAGSVGTCTTVTGAPHGTRPACPSSTAADCAYTCNGTNATACVAPGATTTCSSPTCSSGVATPASKCDGAGNCVAQPTVSCGKFACNAAGTACLTAPCASNADCATGYKCDSGSKDCVPTGAAGSACTISTDCNSGLSCVDGVCCTSASCSGGMKCNVPGAVGTCKLPYGTACTAATATNCATGNCVDGVCCNTACSNQCEQCNQVGSVGTCKPVAAGGSPVGGRTACTGTGACKATCDGSNVVKCGSAPGPSTVCAAATCVSGSATPTRYCDGLGSCTPATSTACGAYKCNTTACKTSCSSAADCTTGYFCNTVTGVCTTTGASGTACTDPSECTSGFCVDGVCCKTSSCASGLTCNSTTDGTCKEPLGSTCTASTECGSGFCVDGVCCDKLCNGQCEACNIGGSVGTCVPVSGAPKAPRAACAGTGVCQSQCNGSDRDKCGAFPGTSTVCSPATCPASGAALTPTAFCDGAGACAVPSAVSCAPYKCSGGSDCKKLCATSADCADGYACNSGVCVTTGELGTVCTDPSQCKSGKCVAGTGGKSVCCSVDTCPTGTVCGGTDSGALAGSCVAPLGGSCTKKEDCASGFCVDGVCCDKACDGQCEACDVSGAKGTCTAVNGAPHGSRTACFDGAGDACTALSCDGSDRLKCVAFSNGPEKECGVKCSGTSVTRSRCDGKGACTPTAPTDCAPYACDSSKGCKTSCAVASDCATGYICAGSTCIPAPSATCDGDTTSKPTDGSPSKECSPYKCDPSTGNCYGTCTSTDQCAPGSVCNAGACAPAPASGDTGDSGGCAVTDSRGGRGASLAALALLAMGLVVRRRAKA